MGHDKDPRQPISVTERCSCTDMSRNRYTRWCLDGSDSVPWRYLESLHGELRSYQQFLVGYPYEASLLTLTGWVIIRINLIQSE